MPILSAEELAFFQENGYVKIEGLIPKADCDAVIATIFDFLEIDPNDPTDWYRDPLPKGGMVEIYQHQSLWNTRQNPRLYEAFTQIHNTQKLWVSLDRVNFKPPRHPAHAEYDFKGFLHVDNDLKSRPIKFWTQGVLYLSDTTEDQGGFQCTPGAHKEIRAWSEAHPADATPPDIQSMPAIPIPGKAGDFVIWDNLLPHGNGHNVSDRPRFSQFISMFPTGEGFKPWQNLQNRIHCWQEREPTGPPVFPGDPRRVEQQRYQTAELTPLGRKLLGIDPW